MLMTVLLTLSLITQAPDAATAETAGTEPSELARLAAEEVEGLHAFFHDWFVGELPDTDEAYARFSDALAEDFTIITPSGAISGRDELLDRLRESHGSGKDAGVKIWIRGFQLRHEAGDLIIVNYEEWQEIGAKKTARVSTAVLKRDDSAPGGVVWLHLHETWLPHSSAEQMIGGE